MENVETLTQDRLVFGPRANKQVEPRAIIDFLAEVLALRNLELNKSNLLPKKTTKVVTTETQRANISSHPDMRVKVKALKEQFLARKVSVVNIKHEHIFYPGVYERKITIPPWTVLTGTEHKTDYKVRIDSGIIAVNTDDGVKIFTGPCEFLGVAGIQRVGRVFKDEVVWTYIYENLDDCTDIAILEERLITIPDSYLGSDILAVELAKVDWQLFLKQVSMTQQQVNKFMESDTFKDLTGMPPEYFVELRDSQIHNKGLFATKQFELGEIVSPNTLTGKKTTTGRYINHSPNPNLAAVKIEDNLFFVARHAIHKDTELVIDYRSSMKVNFGFELLGEINV